MRAISACIALLLSAQGFAFAAGAAVFQSFDGPQVTWRLADARAGAEVVAHGCVGDDARQGSASERIVAIAPPGESLHFKCPVGKVPVLDELECRLWVKSSRPGITLAARVVLPRTMDATTGAARTVLVSGEEYAVADRWQQLRLFGVPSRVVTQARVLRAAGGTAVDVREAYVDEVVLVISGGTGATSVWTDALEVDGIVIAAAANDPIGAATLAINRAPQLSAAGGARSNALDVRLQGETLSVDGKAILSRGIEWNSEPFAFLAARGFNTVWLSEPPTVEQTAEATRVGIWFVCPPPRPDEITDAGLGESTDRVLAWNLGTPASSQELAYYRRWAELVRRNDPVTTRPLIVAPRGDWMVTSRLADILLGEHPASSRIAVGDIAQWLESLPLLARPGTPFWTSIPTQPGKRVREQIAALDRSAPSTMGLPDPQIEGLLSAAITSGSRGVLFTSDSPLDATDPATKRRAQLLELLNTKLEMIGPWLTLGKRVGDAASADSESTAALLQVERARLLVPTKWTAGDEAKGSSDTTVAFIAPGVPESNDAFVLSPAAMRTVPSKRVAGGTRVALEHGSDAWLLLTEDPAVIAGFRQRVARGGRRAAQLQIALATSQTQQLTAAYRQLPPLGIDAKELDQAIAAANAEIGRANKLLSAGNADAAFERAGAARRLLAASVEQQANAAAAPAFDSLPFAMLPDLLVQQARFERSLAGLRGRDNALAGGDFEDLRRLQQLGWRHVDDPLAGIETRVELSATAPREGRYCLMLSAAGNETSPQIVARPLVWIASPPIHASAGDVLEISGWVRVSEPIGGSVDALQIVDSLGGQELALRIRSTDGWQPIRMIRAASVTTDITLSIALCGLGTAYVDGVMVRTLAPPTVKRLPAVGDQPGPQFPTSARRALFDPPRQR